MNYSRGFTLIELIVVVAVIGIISSSAIANYSTIRTQQEIDKDRQKVTSALRQAQTDALALPVEASVDDVCKVGVEVNTSQDKLEWKYWTGSVPTCSSPTPVNFPDRDDVELEFTEITGGPNEVSFNVPFGKLEQPSSGTQEEITLGRGDEEQKVRIYPSGYISVVQ